MPPRGAMTFRRVEIGPAFKLAAGTCIAALLVRRATQYCVNPTSNGVLPRSFFFVKSNEVFLFCKRLNSIWQTPSKFSAMSETVESNEMNIILECLEPRRHREILCHGNLPRYSTLGLITAARKG